MRTRTTFTLGGIVIESVKLVSPKHLLFELPPSTCDDVHLEGRDPKICLSHWTFTLGVSLTIGRWQELMQEYDNGWKLKDKLKKVNIEPPVGINIQTHQRCTIDLMGGNLEASVVSLKNPKVKMSVERFSRFAVFELEGNPTLFLQKHDHHQGISAKIEDYLDAIRNPQAVAAS